MDPLNDERTNEMLERVQGFHDHCVSVDLVAQDVHKRETKAAMHYNRLAEALAKMSNTERNKGLKKSIKDLSDAIAEAQSFRTNLIVDQTSSLLMHALRETDSKCNHPTAVMLKDRNKSVQSSLKFKQQFEALASKTSTSQAKLDKKKAQLQAEEKRVYSIDQSFQKNILKYEEKRIDDISTILNDYVKSQLLFHCRAVETYTKVIKSLSQVDSLEGVEQLCSELHISAKQLNLLLGDRTE